MREAEQRGQDYVQAAVHEEREACDGTGDARDRQDAGRRWQSKDGQLRLKG
jgi:hypothetical protein